jgi:hypothetical protein
MRGAMAATDPHRLEAELIDDLTTLGDRLVDEEFDGELYRTLTNTRWSKRDWRGHVSLSWTRVEDIINALRETHGREPMTLAQTGGEGEPDDDAAARALADLGWTCSPLNTSRHDDAHVESPPDAPPPDTGERQAPVDPGTARWEERAHEDADRERLRRNL